MGLIVTLSLIFVVWFVLMFFYALFNRKKLESYLMSLMMKYGMRKMENTFNQMMYGKQK